MPTFGTRSKIYPFSTENLAGYIPNLDIDGKKVLTVTGSADHAVNSFLFGAREVVGFDLNILASFFAELKIKAVERLDMEQFKKFFLTGSEETMDFEVYSDLRNGLSLECIQFFDGVYKMHGFNGRKVRESKLFNKRLDINELKILINPYLHSGRLYEKARRGITKGNARWVNSSADDLTSKIDVNFDIVMLSNLADYAQSMFPNSHNYLDVFCERVISPLKHHMNSRCIICAAYVYDIKKEGLGEYKSLVDNPEERRRSFKILGMKYEERKIKCTIPGKENRKDMVVILTNP